MTLKESDAVKIGDFITTKKRVAIVVSTPTSQSIVISTKPIFEIQYLDTKRTVWKSYRQIHKIEKEQGKS